MSIAFFCSDGVELAALSSSSYSSRGCFGVLGSSNFERSISSCKRVSSNC